MNIHDKMRDLVALLNREIPTATLVRRGLRIGENFIRMGGCFIDPTHCFLIEIGDNVTMSIRVTLLAHDASTKKLTGYTRMGAVRIGSGVFIGANATILPGVSVGDGAVIGAGSVVSRDVRAGTIVAGVPAREVRSTLRLKESAESAMERAPRFGASYRMGKSLTPEKKAELIAATAGGGIAYIE